MARLSGADSPRLARTQHVEIKEIYPKYRDPGLAAAPKLHTGAGRRRRMTALDRTNSIQDARRVPVFARTLFRHLQDQGYTREQIIGVSAELLSLLSTDLKDKDQLLPAE